MLRIKQSICVLLVLALAGPSSMQVVLADDINDEKLSRAEALTELGHMRTDRFRFAEAAQLYSDAIKLNPELTLAYACRADARVKLHDDVGALTDYDMALKLSPDDAFVYGCRGELKLLTGEIKGALRDLDMADALGLDFFFIYWRRAEAELIARDYEGVIKDCNRAFQYDCLTDSRLYFLRAQAEFHTFNYIASVIDFSLANYIECAATLRRVLLQSITNVNGAHKRATN